MSVARRYDEWDSIVALVQSYARRKYGQACTGITIHLHHGDAHREPFPHMQLQLEFDPARLAEPRERQAAGWASGGEPKHLSDYQQVYWPGLGSFTFSPKQACAVKVLWEALFDGDNPEVDQVAVLGAADSDCARLLDLFRSRGKTHAAWGRLILPGEAPATFRLPEPPGAE